MSDDKCVIVYAEGPNSIDVPITVYKDLNAAKAALSKFEFLGEPEVLGDKIIWENFTEELEEDYDDEDECYEGKRFEELFSNIYFGGGEYLQS